MLAVLAAYVTLRRQRPLWHAQLLIQPRRLEQRRSQQDQRSRLRHSYRHRLAVIDCGSPVGWDSVSKTQSAEESVHRFRAACQDWAEFPAVDDLSGARAGVASQSCNIFGGHAVGG
jgi:hypothetical protein